MRKRPDIFGFRINREERQLIEALAAKLERTPGDAVRYVVLQTARQQLKPELRREKDAVGGEPCREC